MDKRVHRFLLPSEPRVLEGPRLVVPATAHVDILESEQVRVQESLKEHLAFARRGPCMSNSQRSEILARVTHLSSHIQQGSL